MDSCASSDIIMFVYRVPISKAEYNKRKENCVSKGLC